MNVTVSLLSLIAMGLALIAIASLITYWFVKDRVETISYNINRDYHKSLEETRSRLFNELQQKQEFIRDLTSQLNRQRGHIEVCEAFFEKIFRDAKGSIPACDRFFIYQNKIFEAASFSLTENAESSPELLVVFKDTGFNSWFRKEP